MTRMPRWISSVARDLVKVCIAPLVSEYPIRPGLPSRPATEPQLTMRPSAGRCGSAARVM